MNPVLQRSDAQDNCIYVHSGGHLNFPVVNTMNNSHYILTLVFNYANALFNLSSQYIISFFSTTIASNFSESLMITAYLIWFYNVDISVSRKPSEIEIF